MIRLAVLTTFALSFVPVLSAQAQETTAMPESAICPAAEPMVTGLAPDTPDGIIVTAFDGSGIWTYDVARNSRYPLPDTTPCAGACRLSPDGSELLYLYPATNAFNRMRLDGGERSMVVEYAGQVEWWADGQFLVYTPGRNAYVIGGPDGRVDLVGDGIVSVQPNGHWALVIANNAGQPVRALRDLAAEPGSPVGQLPLAPDRLYANAAAWSPSGDRLAFVAPVGATSSEIFGVRPGAGVPQRWTDLTSEVGSVRINGQATGELAWSPDGEKVAFWVIPLEGGSPEAPLQPAIIHILDVTTGQVQRMCGYQTMAHTPNPPRLVWAPDSTHVAFADDVPGQARGTLVVLNTATGEYRALTSGIAPVNGPPNLIAWGGQP